MHTSNSRSQIQENFSSITERQRPAGHSMNDYIQGNLSVDQVDIDSMEHPYTVQHMLKKRQQSREKRGVVFQEKQEEKY